MDWSEVLTIDYKSMVLTITITIESEYHVILQLCCIQIWVGLVRKLIAAKWLVSVTDGGDDDKLDRISGFVNDQNDGSKY